jgi:hypothetical protein
VREYISYSYKTTGKIAVLSRAESRISDSFTRHCRLVRRSHTTYNLVLGTHAYSCAQFPPPLLLRRMVL